ncbi:hypothetical protein [Actinacidiphila oryziradicis]|jgi:hypothetical protein|uniref:hypothetical protein n=1 Tax=Actinacidiphila oryziradicis TaxID=2571141 RepID=UPI0023F4CBAE|nr:hypothetical protein [Actinacidiphila oryziradicis]
MTKEPPARPEGQTGGAVLTEVIDPNLLRLHIRPQSLDGWRWWLDASSTVSAC